MHAQRAEAHRDPESSEPARPGAARLHRPRAPTGPWTTSRTCAPAGVAVPLDGHRPERPYCGGLVVLRANDGGHRYIGAGVGQIALLRAGKRAIPRRPRRQYTSRLMAEWARGNDVRLFCSRTGSRRDSAVAESFFAAPKNEMYCRRNFPTGDSARHAVIESIDRGLLQPPQAPLNDRLQGSGRGYGGLLRGNRAQARGNAYGLLIPRASVSEILTRVTNASGTVTYRRSNLSR